MKLLLPFVFRGLLIVSCFLPIAGYSSPIAAQAQTTIKRKINAKDGLTYVWIPPGTFQMGCSPNDTKCSQYEEPAHSVTVTGGFWIGQTPVTQAAYQKVMNTNPSHFKGEQLPVERVTWDEANTYCDRVGMKLPTEEEWEYAARGGNPAARYGPIDRIAWHKANSAGRTHRVGQKQANAYGLYDMLGNVDEWVEDFYTFYANAGDWVAVEPSPEPHVPLVEGAPDVPYVQTSPSTERSSSRVVRGASWDNDAYFVSGSNRMRYDPGNRHQNVGFRCAGN